MYRASMVALITPMQEDGSIDKKTLCDLIEWHIASKTSAIVIAGTTGESATLDPAEHYDLVSFTVKQVQKRLPVLAGAGTNSTKTTLKLAENAKMAGADACLLVTPYYNKPPQNGLYEHYKFIAEKINLPIILYNVPGRTACDILPETVARLSKITNIIGIKEATPKLERCLALKACCPTGFQIYSGEDSYALEFMLNGADGVISVTANVAPALMHAMCEAALSGNASKANEINDKLSALHKNLFLESNPIPTKWALHHLGKIPSGIRLPLLPLDKRYQDEVKKAMQIAGVM